MRLARAAALDEREVAVGLDADQERRVGHDRAVLRRDVASAFGLEGARQEVQAIGAAGEALQVELEFGRCLCRR